MSASPDSLPGAVSVVQLVRERNAQSIARTGDIEPHAIAELLGSLFDDLRTRQAMLLQVAVFIASHLDDGSPL